jgi:hypothetical protein
MNRICVWVLAIFLFHYSGALAQSNESSIENALIYFTDHLIGDDDDVDLTEVQAELERRQNNPIDLNTATKTQLISFPLLDQTKAAYLVVYRSEYGNLNAIEELHRINGFDGIYIAVIRPFVTVNQEELKDEIGNPFRGNVSFVHSTNKRSPRLETSHLGNQDRYRLRYRNSSQDGWEIGFNAEKDPGEALLQRHKKYQIDYTSAYIAYHRKRKLSNVVVGDYHANFGQGLTFYSTPRFSKVFGSLAVERIFSGLRPHRSMNEYRFLRGIGLELNHRKLKSHLFYSNRIIFANLDDHQRIKTIHTSGLHRMRNEVSKSELSQEIIGANTQFNIGSLELGMVHVRSKFNREFAEAQTRQDPNENRSKHYGNTGFYTRFEKGNFRVFGEVSSTELQGISAVIGSIFMPDKQFIISILHRSLSRDFRPIFSSHFAENSRQVNESGFFLGAEWTLAPGFVVDGFADLYSLKGIQANRSRPDNGTQSFARLRYSPSKSAEFLMQLRSKKSSLNLSQSETIHIPVQGQERRNLRFQLTLQPGGPIRWRMRYETSRVQFQNHFGGSLFFTEFKYKEIERNWNLIIRYTLFSTDNYQSRIYAFEQSPDNASLSSAFWGAGQRYSFMFSSRLIRSVKIQFMLSMTERRETNKPLEQVHKDWHATSSVQWRW